ncbi:MAG: hypothetical protein GY795_46135 [Desulfobacterales bacterium]|nr:hypothetical protein [Desulfobacterales bacterium]
MKTYTKSPALFLVTCAFAVTCLTTPAFASAKWTFMVYLCAENNLEPDGIDDFLEMAKAGSNSNINIVVQMDRINGFDTRYGDWKTCKRFLVGKDTEPTAASALEDIGEVNMGHPDTLKAFIEWGTTNYPADRYAVILWDHGDGWSKKRRKPSSYPPYKAVCGDDTDGGDYLYMNEIKQVLNSVSVKPDMIGFDACLMGMIEVAYQIKDSGASVMVGSEELEPGAGWPYDTVLQELNSNPEWTPEQLGAWIADKFVEAYPDDDATQSAISLLKINALGESVSDFSTVLRTSWNSDKQAVINAAKTVMTRVEDTVINEKHTNNYRGAKGIAIYFPLLSQNLHSDYANTDFAKNTYWDEFLNEYYNAMPGSYIESARKICVAFNNEPGYSKDYIDLHNFCSLIADPPDTSPGYTADITDYNFEEISTTGTKIDISDEGYSHIYPSGFTFSYYGNNFTSFSISDNGVIYFEDSNLDGGYTNENIPGSGKWGETFVAPYWTDLNPETGGQINWQATGTGAEKRLVIQWNDIKPYGESDLNLNGATFQAVLYENGRILFQYKDVLVGNEELDKGAKATVGVQGSTTRGLGYSFNSALINNQTAILFSPVTSGQCSYTLSSTQKIFDSSGGTASVSVTADSECNWTAESDTGWIVITEGKSATGNGTVKYTVAQNTNLSSRTGTMTIAGQTFTITQSSSCSYEILPESKSFSDSGGTGTVSVTASSPDCAWTASSHVNWITVTSGSPGTGDGSVRYSVLKNTGTSSRTGTLAVAGQTLTITQEPATEPEPALLQNGVTVKNLSQWLAGSLYYKIQLPSNATNLQIRTGSGTGDCNLFVKHGTMPTTESYDYKSDQSGNDESIVISAPASGDWYILVYANQAFGGMSLTASYNTTTCSYTLSPASQNFTPGAGDGSFNITTDADCYWTASVSDSWIEIVAGGFGKGDGKTDFRVSQNTGDQGRQGSVTVMDNTFSITQAEAGSVSTVTLANGVALTELSAEKDNAAYYKISVPSGQKKLDIKIYGGNGDCDLYARFGEKPTLQDYDYAPVYFGNNENVTVENPDAGDWYIMLHAYGAAYSGVSLKAAYTDIDCTYTISPADISAESSGGTGSVTVTADSQCAWDVFNADNWITITSDTSGAGNGTVSYSISANTDLTLRTGTILIADAYVYVTQQGNATVTELTNGVEITGLSGQKNDILYYKINVPADQKNLSVTTGGETGDVDLYVRYGAMPTSDSFDFVSNSWGTGENVYVENPEPGTWYIMVSGYGSFSGVYVKAEYNSLSCDYAVTPMTESFPASGGTGTLSVSTGSNCSWAANTSVSWIEFTSAIRGTGNGSVNYKVSPNSGPYILADNIRIADQLITIWQSGTEQTQPGTLTNNVAETVSGIQQSMTYYKIEVPSGQKSLVFEISGGTGDCDLLVKYGTLPTFSQYDFFPYIEGNDEQAETGNPQAGTWYVMLSGYTAYENVSLTARYSDEGEDFYLADAITVLQILTGFSPSLSSSSMLLDFDKNGRLSSEDAIYIIQSLAGFRTD